MRSPTWSQGEPRLSRGSYDGSDETRGGRQLSFGVGGKVPMRKKKKKESLVRSVRGQYRKLGCRDQTQHGLRIPHDTKRVRHRGKRPPCSASVVVTQELVIKNTL